MSGIRRLINGSIAQGNLRGRPLSDALASQLNSTGTTVSAPTKKAYAKRPKKK